MGAIDVNQQDSDHGDQEADQKTRGKLLILEDKVGTDRHEKRSQRGDDAHVGGVGVGQGDVFQEEIEGNPGEADSGKIPLMTAALEFQGAWIEEEQSEKTDHESEDKNLDGGEALEQDFRENKSHPPNHHGHQGNQVTG